MCSTEAFVPLNTFQPTSRILLNIPSATSLLSLKDDVEKLRDSASRLRKEAEELEAKIKERRGAKSDGSAVDVEKQVIKRPTSLDNSEWTISYRFASDPTNSNTDNNEEKEAPLTFYSGKVGLRFTSDGYTDIVDDGQVSKIQYSKVWGWDEEVSNEDGLRYLFFSADIDLPDSDRNAGKDRFYFQARVEQDERTGEISIVDGKVTVKRDIEPPGGFWGVFSGKGILAQFRICGDFICRPR